MRALFFLAAALIAAPDAEAKSLKKMTDAEVLDAFQNETKADKRIDAAGELGNRRTESAIGALGGSCGGDEAAVCAAALDALAAYNSSASWTAVQDVFERPEAPAAQRIQALELLQQGSPNKIAESAFTVMSRYRSMDPALGVATLQAIQSQSVSDMADATLYIARDEDAERSMRLAALDAAESFDHPRLFEAFLALLDDQERTVRVRCAEGLNATGLPGSRVFPALHQAFKEDVEGSVRAAAARGLWNYANPQLLPALYEALLNEKHPYTWENAFPLLLALADETTVEPLSEALAENRRLTDPVLFELVALARRLDNPDVVVALRAREQMNQGSELSESCREVAEILELKEIERPEIPPWSPDPAISMWSPEDVDPVFAELRVDLQNNLLVRR